MKTISQAPSANLATAKISVTMPVDTAPKPLISALRRQPAVRSFSQCRTMPACDSVIDVKTPIAYSGIRASTNPPNATRTTIATTARTTMPALNASRSPRNENRLGMNPSRARIDDWVQWRHAGDVRGTTKECPHDAQADKPEHRRQEDVGGRREDRAALAQAAQVDDHDEEDRGDAQRYPCVVEDPREGGEDGGDA